MPGAHPDTSALVKPMVSEPESVALAGALEGVPTTSSALVRTELRRAVARQDGSGLP